jgi:cold-inducible RNA-binding protein
MKNLFIGNVSFQTTESELRSAFEAFGEIKYIRLIVDRATGKSRGFAFIDMGNEEDAKKAIAALHQAELGGRKLIVTEAHPKPERATPINSGYENAVPSYQRTA